MKNIDEVFEKYNGIFKCGKNMDMITRELEICGKKAYVFLLTDLQKKV